jgi:hypothetical protein
MLTESREAMNLRTRRKYLQWHPYRRHSSTPTHFCRQRQCARFAGVALLFPPYHRDGAGAAVMEICRIFESRFVRSDRVALK